MCEKKKKKISLQRSYFYIALAAILSFVIITPGSRTNHEESHLSYAQRTLCHCLFCEEIGAYAIPQRKQTDRLPATEKSWTLIMLIAGDNDLKHFVARNMKQAMAIGSNKYINILVHLDIRIANNQKISRRYIIEKGKIFHVNAHDPTTQKMDSGNPKTLISACEWAINDYPAENYALFLWNHGTGDLDPMNYRGRMISPVELFSFNASTNRFDLNRRMELFDLIESEVRGVCWDDTTGNYLSNPKINEALNKVCRDYLKGKFSIIGFDACLMGGIGVMSIMRQYADIMIASEDVELGTGWNYEDALSPFLTHAPTKEELAHHIVQSYKKTYTPITNDFTLSAIRLGMIGSLEQNIDTVSNLLLECIKKQRGASVKNAIQKSRNRFACTHFDEPSYIDLYHFYENLQKNLSLFLFNNTKVGQELKNRLNKALDAGKKIMNQAVFSHVCGKNISGSHGISIYFPEQGKKIHASYRQGTPFAISNAWTTLISQFAQL